MMSCFTPGEVLMVCGGNVNLTELWYWFVVEVSPMQHVFIWNQFSDFGDVFIDLLWCGSYETSGYLYLQSQGVLISLGGFSYLMTQNGCFSFLFFA